MGTLGFGLQEAYDMSWAEFVLRSDGYRKKQEREEMLFREIAYQSHCGQYMFSKKSPPRKEAWWPIGRKKSQTIGEEQRQAYLEAVKKYKEQKNGG